VCGYSNEPLLPRPTVGGADGSLHAIIGRFGDEKSDFLFSSVTRGNLKGFRDVITYSFSDGESERDN
jgi:hypothetical protein